MTIKPWREIAEPRDDVCSGNFQQAEFAADISAVHQGRAGSEYQDPELFFQMTYITEGMKQLIETVLRRISGTGGDPIIQLKTAFGGGKTHSLLSIYHIARQTKPLSTLNGLTPILNGLNICDPPSAKIVVIDGTNQNASEPKIHGTQHIHTLWGEIAWQLGGESAYDLVRTNDLEGTAPTKDKLVSLLSEYAPVVILIDELVLYIRQFEEDKTYSGGTFDSNLSFIQNLTEAVKQVPTAVLLASLPESSHEAGSQRAQETLTTLEHYFGRVQAVWRPVDTQESFEIVRRRLFKPITDTIGKEDVCRAFTNLYRQQPDNFPNETQESSYYQHLLAAYPIHPEIFDRLYNDWSSLPNFQRTRGVLKLMAKVISRLWAEGNTDYLIMPGSLPLASEVKTEFLALLPAGWDPVIDGDIDGERSEAQRIELNNQRFGQVLACRKVARTIFLGTAPGSQNKLKKGIERQRILLGSVQPSQQPAVFSDALDQIISKFHYLNIGENQYWFDIRQNLNKEMDDRKLHFNKDEYIRKETKDILKKIITSSTGIDDIHIYVQSLDIPDDCRTRLIVLPYTESYLKGSRLASAETAAKAILQNHGEQLRKYQNRLIFLAADGNCVNRFKEYIVSMLAWKSILADYAVNRITLDNTQADYVREKIKSSEKTAKSAVRECYKHLLIPTDSCPNGIPATTPEWEEHTINTQASDVGREIQKLLIENECLLPTWAPIHLHNELTRWFWKNSVKITAETFWDASCRYLYLPRLSSESVLNDAIAKGQGVKDWFGIAAFYDDATDTYKDFRFGPTDRPFTPDKNLLLIQPEEAERYLQKLQQEQPVPEPKNGDAQPPSSGYKIPPTTTGGAAPRKDTSPTPEPVYATRFFGSVELDSISALNNFKDINDEVLQHFIQRSDVTLTIRVEISAESKDGFETGIQRTIKENCMQLKFDERNTGFE
ncbi:MAG TPA: DUF499 domain-containing protein [Methanocorpusculum sp.]|nr:DUF499 domain-containing protein [Methanocorpusculum sp.]HJK80764.1 DUF499 domain-containing protein [Methanocorpusculum sp.]